MATAKQWKSQTTISKHQTIQNIQSPKSSNEESPFVIWKLEFVICLEFGNWNLEFPSASHWVIPHLRGGFPLRCFQRLSGPNIATLRCPWQDSRYTRGSFVLVLSSCSLCSQNQSTNETNLRIPANQPSITGGIAYIFPRPAKSGRGCRRIIVVFSERLTLGYPLSSSLPF